MKWMKKKQVQLPLSTEAAEKLYALILKESDRLLLGPTPNMADERTPYLKSCRAIKEAAEFAVMVKFAVSTGKKIGVL